MREQLRLDDIAAQVELEQNIPGFPYRITKEGAKKLVQIGGLSAWMLELEHSEFGKVIPHGHVLAELDDYYNGNRWVAGQAVSPKNYGSTICGYSCYSSFAAIVDMIPEDADFVLHVTEFEHPDDGTSTTLRIYVTLDQINYLTPGELSVLIDHQG